MRSLILYTALVASVHATIDFNKLINGISSFPVAHDVDNSLNIRRDLLLAARQPQAAPSGGSGANQAYLESVCSPNVGSNPSPIPPCISINTIQTLCQPNGTSPLAYQAHAQCLCNAPSSFFSDWLGCRRCLVFHGGLSERDFNYNRGLLAAVSGSLCGSGGASATTDFAAYFATATVGNSAAVGATTSSDAAPSQSAVSLYYTPSGVQGQGVITGSATAATGTGSPAITSGSGSGTSRTTGTSTSTSRAASGSAAGSSGFAVATAAPVLPALMALGGIAAAVL